MGNPEDSEKPYPFSTILSFIFPRNKCFLRGPQVSFSRKNMLWGQYSFLFPKRKLQVTKKKIRIFSKGWKMPMIQKPLFICKSKPKSYMGMYKKAFKNVSAQGFLPTVIFRPGHPIFNLKHIQLLGKGYWPTARSEVWDLFSLCSWQRGP